jgi:hypothetical protein
MRRLLLGLTLLLGCATANLPYVAEYRTEEFDCSPRRANCWLVDGADKVVVVKNPTSSPYNVIVSYPVGDWRLLATFEVCLNPGEEKRFLAQVMNRYNMTNAFEVVQLTKRKEACN